MYAVVCVIVYMRKKQMKLRDGLGAICVPAGFIGTVLKLQLSRIRLYVHFVLNYSN